MANLAGLRAGGLADVADLAVLAVEHDGDPLPAVERIARALPTQKNPPGLELQAQSGKPGTPKAGNVPRFRCHARSTPRIGGRLLRAPAGGMSRERPGRSYAALAAWVQRTGAVSIGSYV
jgi:hypothetical protein